MNKDQTLQVGIEVDWEELKTAVAEIESAFPKIIFKGRIKNVYVNYTQNNFKDDDEHDS